LLPTVSRINSQNLTLLDHVDQAIENDLKRQPQLSTIHGDFGVTYGHVLHSCGFTLIQEKSQWMSCAQRPIRHVQQNIAGFVRVFFLFGIFYGSAELFWRAQPPPGTDGKGEGLKLSPLQILAKLL
jgi:hypothetical protein